ncbi:hypothetical protein, partial [Mycobacterium tuberculosis]|uniref:hypothetical protein n=1 Tax=Mycobacterium tuberculosis TaxID=1773 RepID=UPI001BE09833
PARWTSSGSTTPAQSSTCRLGSANAQIEQVVDLWGRQLDDRRKHQDFAKVDTEIDLGRSNASWFQRYLGPL